MSRNIILVLVFMVYPGVVHAADQASPPNSLIVNDAGDVGVGTASPTSSLHIVRPQIKDAGVLMLERQGAVEFGLKNGTTETAIWRMRHPANGKLVFATATNNNVFSIDRDGNIYSSGTRLDVPDYVFAPDYKLMPLGDLARFISEKQHLPGMPTENDVKSGGLNITDMQMRLLKKVEELTLHTLNQQKLIEAQQRRIEALEAGVSGSH